MVLKQRSLGMNEAGRTGSLALGLKFSTQKREPKEQTQDREDSVPRAGVAPSGCMPYLALSSLSGATGRFRGLHVLERFWCAFRYFSFYRSSQAPSGIHVSIGAHVECQSVAHVEHSSLRAGVLAEPWIGHIREVRLIQEYMRVRDVLARRQVGCRDGPTVVDLPFPAGKGDEHRGRRGARRTRYSVLDGRKGWKPEVVAYLNGLPREVQESAVGQPDGTEEDVLARVAVAVRQREGRQGGEVHPVERDARAIWRRGREGHLPVPDPADDRRASSELAVQTRDPLLLVYRDRTEQ